MAVNHRRQRVRRFEARDQGRPAETREAQVVGLSHEGRGVARINGKTVFIDGALPGETVQFRVARRHRQFDEGVVTAVLKPGPGRVTPPCPHVAVCGGCTLQHLDPAAQLRHKQDVLAEQFEHAGGLRPEQWLPPVTGPVAGYRRKARLSVKYVVKKDKVLVGFREPRSNRVAELDRCIVLHPSLGDRLTELSGLIARLSIRDAVPQIEVASGENHSAIVIRHLGALSEADAGVLRAFENESRLKVYLQPGGADSVHALSDMGSAELTYRLPDQDIEFAFGPTDFTQVNLEINRELVRLLLELLAPTREDRVLDLFCGVGNFTLPLARRAGSVTGIEGSALLVEKARRNAARNAIDNVEFEHTDLASPALDAAILRRDYDQVVLDPPRTGAREVLQQLELDGARTLAYVSCNPATLARDAALLVRARGWTLKSARILDMFPHTSHVESLAWFER